MKKGNFTMVPNHCLEDTGLSIGARGLLSYMLSRPPSWKFIVENLSKKAVGGSLPKTRKLLKELQGKNYLKMEKVLDEKANKFLGSRYVLNRMVIDNPPSMALSDSENPESRISRPSENANVGKTELRQSTRHNKTETNKSEALKNKGYQQQEKQVAAVAGDIDIFFQGLLQDETWTNSFQNEMLDDRLITRHEFELILFQFREHALRKNDIYSDLQGVKYHFLNWLNTQKYKRLLQSKLQKEKLKQIELTKKADALTSKVNQIVDMRNALNFPSKEKVLEAKLMLESSNASLTEMMKTIQGKDVREIMVTTLHNARKLIDLIERASEKNGLEWFCENAKPSN